MEDLNMVQKDQNRNEWKMTLIRIHNRQGKVAREIGIQGIGERYKKMRYVGLGKVHD